MSFNKPDAKKHKKTKKDSLDVGFIFDNEELMVKTRNESGELNDSTVLKLSDQLMKLNDKDLMKQVLYTMLLNNPELSHELKKMLTDQNSSQETLSNLECEIKTDTSCSGAGYITPFSKKLQKEIVKREKNLKSLNITENTNDENGSITCTIKTKNFDIISPHYQTSPRIEATENDKEFKISDVRFFEGFDYKFARVSEEDLQGVVRERKKVETVNLPDGGIEKEDKACLKMSCAIF